MAGYRFSPAQKLLVVFILTIFAPGLLLAIFGARALWQERGVAESQLRERLDRGADVTTRVLSDELTNLQSMFAEDVQADRMFRSLPKDGSWAYVERRDGRLQVYPQDVLPYELSPPAVSLPSEPGAIETKHHEARASREAGRTVEAVRLWREIEQSKGRIGSLPADLVAGFELAAADAKAAKAFHRHLIDSRWRLEKARYLYYLSEIQKRLDVKTVPDQRLRFAEAVESIASSASRLVHASGETDETYLALRRDAPFPVSS